MMKILYAIQATGNGHISRAVEVIPYLQQHGEVFIFISGIQSDIRFPYNIDFKKYGLSFIFGKEGNIDLWSTVKSLKPFKLLRDISQVKVNEYDLIVNDFEPITAWACKRKGRTAVSLSHQASFMSDKVPRPNKKSWYAEKILRYYAPTTYYLGLHFESYDENIKTPIIRSSIRKLKPEKGEHVTVYLPAYSDDILWNAFAKVSDVSFNIFSKHAKQSYTQKNVCFFPAGSPDWEESFRTSLGVIMGGGFEGPSEALYLGKKLLVLPMMDQYEQVCNGVALRQMGVKVCNEISANFPDEVKEWLKEDQKIEKVFPFHTDKLVEEVVAQA